MSNSIDMSSSYASYLPSEYLSGGMSISGLTGDTDFNGMIDKLRQIEMIPTQRMLRWKQEWQARQDAFGIVREALVNLRDVCSKMSSIDSFLTKIAASSNSNIASATASSEAIANSYKLEVNREASTNIWSLNSEFAAGTTKVTATGTSGTFAYEYQGSVRTLTVPPDTSLEQLKNMINNDTNNPGVRASLIKSANGVTFQIKGMDTGAKNSLSILSTNGLTGGFAGQNYEPHKLVYKTNISNPSGGSVYANAATSEQIFTYSYNGVTRNVAIPANATLDQFKQAIDDDKAGVAALAGFTVSIENDPSGNKNLVFAGNVPNQAISVPKGGNFADLGTPTTVRTQKQIFNTSLMNSSDPLTNLSASPQTFAYSYNGVTRNVLIPASATLDQFKQAIDDDKEAYRRQIAIDNGLDPDDPADQSAIDAFDKLKDLTVSIESNASGTQDLVFTGTDVSGSPISVSSGGTFAALGTPTSGGSGSWHVKEAQNAQIKVDGWPSGADEWLEVDSNTVSDVVDGLTFNIIGAGTTVISVSTDTEAVTQNVVDFIDAVNNLRGTIGELTKYDPNKTTVDYNYAQTQFEMQKGSLLTGNYGVQLISSRLKQATAGMPMGFLPQFKVGDLALGDLYTSLSQLGIKTKATGEGGEGFGLLELNTDPSLPLLDDILTKNPEAVADFFSALNKGVSDSSDFSFVSSLQSITRPGAFDVTYELGPDGKVKPGTAFINGKAAKYDENTGQLSLVRTPPSSSGTVTLPTNVTNATDPFADAAGKFYYTYDGQQFSVDVAANASLNDIMTSINAAADNPGVTASLVQNGGQYSLVLDADKSVNLANTTPTTSWNFPLAAGVTADTTDKVVKSVATASTDGSVDFTADITVNQEAVAASSRVTTGMTSKDDPIADVDGRFYYTYNDVEYSVDVTKGAASGDPKPDTLATLAQKINFHHTNPGVRASVEKVNGQYELVIKSTKQGDEDSVTNLKWNFTPAAGTNLGYSTANDTAGQDGDYEITYTTPGSPPRTVRKTDAISNTVTIPGLIGVTFNLKGAGTTTINGVKHNDADGIAIQIDNRTPGTYSGTARIKQGKINEILEMLNGTPNKPEEGILGSKGTLQVLVDNYKGIMDGIDKKIERETNRLIKWERNIKLRFSRLEATLQQYESLQASIESQVKQLGGNS